MIKNLKHAKERLDRGPKNIRKDFLNGQTREEYTNDWKDDCLLGVLHSLHKSDENNKLTHQDISEKIGWGWRTIQHKLYKLMSKSSKIRKAIKTEKRKVRDPKLHRNMEHSFYWIDNEMVSTWTFEELVEVVTNEFVKRDEPNYCEKRVLELALDLQPGRWEFNGNNRQRNQTFDGLIPDIINREDRLIIEHFGSIWHRKKDEEKNRIDRLEKQGYKALIIWDYNEKNKNEVKQMIKEFIEDNAI